MCGAEGVAPRIDLVGLLLLELDIGLVVLAELAIMDRTFVRDALIARAAGPDVRARARDQNGTSDGRRPDVVLCWSRSWLVALLAGRAPGWSRSRPRWDCHPEYRQRVSRAIWTLAPMGHGATRRLPVYSQDSTSRRGPDARPHMGHGSPNVHGDETLWTRGVEESGRARQSCGQGWRIARCTRGHLAWHSPAGAVAVSSGSPNDWRAIHKLRADLRRHGLALGHVP